jgi:hypothetical protein
MPRRHKLILRENTDVKHSEGTSLSTFLTCSSRGYWVVYGFTYLRRFDKRGDLWRFDDDDWDVCPSMSRIHLPHVFYRENT